MRARAAERRCVSYEGTRTAIERVGFPIEQPYRPWFFNATAAPQWVLEQKPNLYGPSLTTRGAGPQLGGHVVEYAHNLSFATVHGSGHMVPQFRPRASLHMLSKLLGGLPLTPPFASNATLTAMSSAAFDAYLDRWTDAARAPPFVPV